MKKEFVQNQVLRTLIFSGLAVVVFLFLIFGVCMYYSVALVSSLLIAFICCIFLFAVEVYIAIKVSKNISTKITEMLKKSSAENLAIKEDMSKKREEAIEEYKKIINGIKSSIGQIDIGAEQVAIASQSLAAVSAEQAAQIENISSDISEARNSSKSNVEFTSMILSNSKGSIAVLERLISGMKDVVLKMQSIFNSFNEIKKISKEVESIAFKTNILALNASIEAAHAGEAGKGFSVVAEEVRSLSVSSDTAAKTAEQVILKSIKDVENGMNITKSTDKLLKQVEESIRMLDSYIEKMHESSKEQLVSFVEVEDETLKITGEIQTNSATAEETAAASEEISGQIKAVTTELKQIQN